VARPAHPRPALNREFSLISLGFCDVWLVVFWSLSLETRLIPNTSIRSQVALGS
jgi:hypothetical protein